MRQQVAGTLDSTIRNVAFIPPKVPFTGNFPLSSAVDLYVNRSSRCFSPRFFTVLKRLLIVPLRLLRCRSQLVVLQPATAFAEQNFPFPLSHCVHCQASVACIA